MGLLCKDIAITADPEMSTSDGNLKIDVQGEVRFKRMLMEEARCHGQCRVARPLLTLLLTARSSILPLLLLLSFPRSTN